MGTPPGPPRRMGVPGWPAMCPPCAPAGVSQAAAAVGGGVFALCALVAGGRAGQSSGRRNGRSLLFLLRPPEASEGRSRLQERCASLPKPAASPPRMPLPGIFCWALLTGGGFLAELPPADGAVLSLQLQGQPVREVSPAFLSLTLDANLATDPRYITFLGSTKLRTLARGLSPGFLRFGGTKTDFLIFDPKKEPTLEEEIFQHFLVKQDAAGICGFRSVPLDVVQHLRSQWPFQEMLILREQQRKKYKNTTITQSTVDILYNFANCSYFHLIFGLNALLRKDSQWNSSNAQLVLDYANSQNYNMSWELGNEPNSFRHKSGIYVDGYQLGQDFIHLHQLLNNYSNYRNAKLYGPDVGRPRKQTQKLLRSYYLNGRTATKQDFLSPDVLDTFITDVQLVLQIVDNTVPGKKVWLGETSSAYGGGAPRLSNTYLAGFMWLDKLGLSARLGIDVVMRQVFFGAGNYHLVDANFEPLPDYWLSLLFKKLVGTKVLQVTLTDDDPKKLRVYLHCTNDNNPRYREGDITLFALNLYNSTKHLQLPSYLSNKAVDEYLLLPYRKENILSRWVQLNHHVLKMLDDETLPSLREKPLSPGSRLELPAFSYGFYVIKNAKAMACI
ncbi:heparanase isoform X2 [Hemicordylus capensis]|uniref:heparanase isoform X2 n=1 Tax=Hemicordylus capensis TaxID=884348 RepID=UPI0023034982|nr:heparanase isoform X2 [Hemicordylus capensis]